MVHKKLRYKILNSITYVSWKHLHAEFRNVVIQQASHLQKRKRSGVWVVPLLESSPRSNKLTTVPIYWHTRVNACTLYTDWAERLDDTGLVRIRVTGTSYQCLVLVFWLSGWDSRLTGLRPLLQAFCPSPDEDEWRSVFSYSSRINTHLNTYWLLVTRFSNSSPHWAHMNKALGRTSRSSSK
jgi:hypothetical protein